MLFLRGERCVCVKLRTLCTWLFCSVILLLNSIWYLGTQGLDELAEAAVGECLLAIDP